MTEYQIQPNTRRCVVTGRDLQPGERYYTALLEEGDRLVRQDYCADAWCAPPAGTFSFWSGRVPPPDDAGKPRFDDDALEQCFQRLQEQNDPGRINFRYVVALLLIRRKRLRFEQSIFEDGVEKLELTNPKTGARHFVVNPQLSAEEMNQVQTEVFQVLGWN